MRFSSPIHLRPAPGKPTPLLYESITKKRKPATSGNFAIKDDQASILSSHTEHDCMLRLPSHKSCECTYSSSRDRNATFVHVNSSRLLPSRNNIAITSATAPCNHCSQGFDAGLMIVAGRPRGPLILKLSLGTASGPKKSLALPRVMKLDFAALRARRRCSYLKVFAAVFFAV
jgi:hypothetical protein